VSALDSLVRLHRWQLDEQRRQLAELEGLAGRLRAEAERLAAEQVREQATAARSIEAGSAYGGYARRLIERRDKLAQSLAAVEQEIVAARDAVNNAFQEMKRYETAAANRAAQRQRRLARAEQRVLDEIGLEMFRRGARRPAR
jgi:flagellar FliJ protein